MWLKLINLISGSRSCHGGGCHGSRKSKKDKDSSPSI